MNLQLETDDLKISEFATRVLHRKAREFNQRTERLYPGAGPFKVRLTRPGRDEWRLEISAQIGDRSLKVDQIADDELKVIQDGMRQLLRQYDRLRLHKLPALGRRARSRGLHRGHRPHTAVRSLNPELLADLYPSIVRMAVEQAALYQATGELEPGYVDPVDIVDEVVSEAMGQIRSDAGLAHLKRDFHDRIDQRIKDHLQRYEEESETSVSTDLDVPELSESLELSTLGDELLDYWVIDEDLLLEDVMENPMAKNPEELVADKEARRVLMNSLLRLPARARYVFTSHVMDENSLEDVVKYFDGTLEEAKRLYDEAVADLTWYLKDRAGRMLDGRVVDLYKALARKFRVDPFGMSQHH